MLRLLALGLMTIGAFGACNPPACDPGSDLENGPRRRAETVEEIEGLLRSFGGRTPSRRRGDEGITDMSRRRGPMGVADMTPRRRGPMGVADMTPRRRGPMGVADMTPRRRGPMGVADMTPRRRNSNTGDADFAGCEGNGC